MFVHAKWESKEKAQEILSEMQKDGTIKAETAESILASNFPPERSHADRLKPWPGRER